MGEEVMKLSDAITAGAAMFMTTGPSFNPVFIGNALLDRPMVMNDCLSSAQVGLLGHLPATCHEYNSFYYDNPWGATHDTTLEYWMRLTAIHGYKWSEVISKLKGHGA